jgi:hypothetical protein
MRTTLCLAILAGIVNCGHAAELWEDAVAEIRRDTPEGGNSLLDFDKLLFVRRSTYTSSHYYTEYVDSRWTPGGNLCVLDLKTGNVTELVPELKNGVFGRFDLSFDAKRIAFGWKCDAQEGYRIYEIGIDPATGTRTGKLRQVTFPPDNEKELQKLYRVRANYHHGTDDRHPCYLPDGGFCFISTRCQYGILCDPPDNFTTTVLYRVDADGKNMKRLSNSSVSEASPVMLPDGRIMYSRWEYVDKGSVSVKCLWAMRPDGSGSVEIYGNDILDPNTMSFGRPIPNHPNQYVFLGVPHCCPQNTIGTVFKIDMTKNIRTTEPMTHITPDVKPMKWGGFIVRDADGKEKRDQGFCRLFRDPYPLSDKFFLVAHKPSGPAWNDLKAYGLYVLNEKGEVRPVYKDPDISCWQPFPLRPREVPPVLPSTFDRKLAEQKLAVCTVADIYHGMEDVRRGTIKYIRVLEQVPRPWAARRHWGGDCYDQQYACVTKNTHLGLKVQHGVVPVEEDGSAHFVVPADKNIFFQTLDENYMSVQTERTYVNYMPGERRDCIGCHETPNDAAVAKTSGVLKAFTREASVPGPQIGEKSGGRPLDFAVDVQPVLDTHCVKCHGGDKPKGNLDLRGTQTKLFSKSYENLLNRKYLPIIGENHPKAGNVHYLPARSLGSHNSLLVAMHAKGKVKLKDPNMARRAAELAKEHKDVAMSPTEFLKITNWVDTNGQYYGMYWGRKHLQHKAHPNFRPVPTFARATSCVSQIPEGQR